MCIDPKPCMRVHAQGCWHSCRVLMPRVESSLQHAGCLKICPRLLECMCYRATCTEPLLHCSSLHPLLLAAGSEPPRQPGLPPSIESLRLVNGSSPSQGFLEVLTNGTWAAPVYQASAQQSVRHTFGPPLSLSSSVGTRPHTFLSQHVICVPAPPAGLLPPGRRRGLPAAGLQWGCRASQPVLTSRFFLQQSRPKAGLEPYLLWQRAQPLCLQCHCGEHWQLLHLPYLPALHATRRQVCSCDMRG